MSEIFYLAIGLIGGALLGGAIAAVMVRASGKAAAARQAADLGVQLAREQSTVAELRAQLAQSKEEAESQGARFREECESLRARLREESEGLRAQLQTEQQARVAAETRAAESLKNIAEQRRLLEEAERKLKEAFTAVSAEVLRQNSEQFAKQAAEKVQPLNEALKRYEGEIRQIEKSRQESYAGLSKQIEQMTATQTQLSQNTGSLVHALRTPQVKGRWGELQLRRAVEVAGLSAHCDYIEQLSTETEEGRLRPDLLVKLPGERTIVIDAKVSTNAYLDALGESEEGARQPHLQRYAKAVREHVRQLSSKAYWNQFESAPDFVVMFVPGESFFSAALEQDRTLIEDALKSRVILASPTTLIALLRAVAYGWQQQALLENARHIGETAKQLYERVCTFAEHLSKVGDQLRRASETYNAAAASWEARVAPLGRRVQELGVSGKQGEFVELPRIDVTTRNVAQGE